MNKKLHQIDISIGKRIRTLREVWGMSQTQLAKKIGVSFQQVQKYEKGITRITVFCLLQFCDIFGVSSTSFIDERINILKVVDPLPLYDENEIKPEEPLKTKVNKQLVYY